MPSCRAPSDLPFGRFLPPPARSRRSARQQICCCTGAAFLPCTFKTPSSPSPSLSSTRHSTSSSPGTRPSVATPLDALDRRYLYFVEPLISASQMDATREAVEQFRADAGPRAHQALKADAEHHPGTSYIAAMWYDMYLKNRDPFPLNLTPQLTWKPHENPQKNEQAVRAADICHAAARFYASLKTGNLAPDVFHTKPHLSQHPLAEFVQSMLPSPLRTYSWYALGAYPLDMSQYENLYCSTRVPHVGKDELRKADHSSYVAVMRGSDVFKVHLFKPDGDNTDGTRLELLPASAIEAQFRAVLAAPPSDAPPVGALTGVERDSWARTRAHMEKHPANRAAFRDLDSALFVLTLDGAAPESHEDLSRSMLHGDARNRWFDKSFNIIVCANGEACASWIACG
jgi:carnitine O-palmitoyltransferase 2